MAGECFGDVVQIAMGQSPSGDTCNCDGLGLPLLNGPTEYGTHHPLPVQFTTDARKRAQPGDLLFCVRGSTTGRMNWADREYAIGRGVAAVRHKQDCRLQAFVRAVIEYELPGLLAQATGSTFQNVSASQLAALAWPHIPLPEQRAIAHILGTLDDKIELNRRMNETLEAMARALFKSWFVDFDPVRAKCRGEPMCSPQPGQVPKLDHAPHSGQARRPAPTEWPQHILDLFPDRFVESELGKIPKGWEVGCFGDIVEQIRDSENPLASQQTFFRHYSIPAFDDGQWPKTELGECIKSQKSRVPPGTILLSKLNPEIERVWLTDVGEGDKSVCSTEFLVLRPRTPFGQSFAYCFARSPKFRQEIQALVTGTSKSHQRARPPAVMALPVVLPPRPLRELFEKTAAPLLGRTLSGRRESRTLASLRDTLLQKLISGELRVPLPLAV